MKEGSKGKDEGVEDQERRKRTHLRLEGRQELRRDKDGARFIRGRRDESEGRAREYLVKMKERRWGEGVEG